MVNANLFKAMTLETGKTYDEIAEMLGFSKSTLYRKLNGSSLFSVRDIQKIRKELELTPMQIEKIFFTEEIT